MEGARQFESCGTRFCEQRKKKKKRLHWSRDRNKGTKFSVIKAGNDWGLVLHEGLDR